MYAAAPTTAGTGLTYSAGSFSVNTSQNIATLSNLTTNGVVGTYNSAGQLYTTATTTLAFSGPFSGTGALGTLVGGTNSTVSYYGLSTTSAISAQQILYGTSASGVASVATGTVSAGSGIALDATRYVIGGNLTVSNIAPSKWATSTIDTEAISPAGALRVGIGTSTPKWALQVAATTGPQLTLSDSAGDLHWSFRNTGGTFYLATSSDTTFATSTVAALSIDSTQKVTFGNSQQTCIGLTGSAALCDGSDDGAGGAAFPFTQDTNFSQNTVSTSTAA